MKINYQDKNLVVMYIQIYLKEYFGLSVKRIVPRKKSEPVKYVITNNEPVRVTGYFNTQTYSSLALWMAYNYPREGFPYLWKKTISNDGVRQKISWEKDKSFFRDLTKEWREGDVTSGGYFVQEVDNAGNPVYTTDSQGNRIPKMINYRNLKDFEQVKDRELMKYGYVDASQLNEVLKETPTGGEIYVESKYLETLKDIIVQNIENSSVNPSTVEIPERVLSYILGEVVTEKSTKEEIMRVKKMVYGTPLNRRKAFTYDDEFVLDVIKIQSQFRRRLVDVNGNIQVPKNPDGTPVSNAAIYQTMLENYTVTGYVDPWAEIAIKKGVELDE